MRETGVIWISQVTFLTGCSSSQMGQVILNCTTPLFLPTANSHDPEDNKILGGEKEQMLFSFQNTSVPSNKAVVFLQELFYFWKVTLKVFAVNITQETSSKNATLKNRSHWIYDLQYL